MKDRKYEFVVVGSGAGGATLARELSKSGKDVLVADRGPKDQDLGGLRQAFGVYDMNRLGFPKKSKEELFCGELSFQVDRQWFRVAIRLPLWKKSLMTWGSISRRRLPRWKRASNYPRCASDCHCLYAGQKAGKNVSLRNSTWQETSSDSTV